jgi:site-specific DNA recombinase
MRLSQHTRLDSLTPQSTPINRYIIYCRKSSESDERQVQSLSDQINILLPFISQKRFEIYSDPLQESKSAKAPGRPLFDQMIQFVEHGYANGIILLNPSRLSRNTVDTGRVIFLMDQGKLLEVVTPQQTFRNNPSDRFILNLLCSQAKLENDNKSVTVKDAMRLKAERGDFPGRARVGYINNRAKNQGQRDISAHPIYFSLMRKLIDLALTANHGVQTLCKRAEEMGIRSDTGRIIGKSSLHRYLRDPFYTGRFIYRNRLYKGNHPALMTDDEFNLLQDIIERKGKPKVQYHDVPLNGIMHCGECKFSITAEFKTKHYKNGTSQTFAYYRCTKKSKQIRCSQSYVSQTKLNNQIIEELQHFELEKEFAQWAFDALEEVKGEEHNTNESSNKALQAALDGIEKRINNLIELKISPNNHDGSLLSDDELSTRKQLLLQEKLKISDQLCKTANDESWAEIGRDNFSLALIAAIKFKFGEKDDKKSILKTVGSDLIIQDQKLQFQPRYLFIKYRMGVKKTKEEIERFGLNNSLINQSNLEYFIKNSIWYPKRDSNPRPYR